ncbi:MAG: hypothetical protein INR71_08935, partial [Terriglobus roseus]|nr:hypothetical protein [Terriglobus roseus]
MGSHRDVPLPIIDISPYLDASQSTRRGETAAALNAACVEHGFFYLTGLDIPSSTTECVLELARRFFLQCSPQEKSAIRRRDPGDGDGDGARGYQEIGENVTKGRRDWHEAIDFYAEHHHDAASGPVPPYELLGGRNLWPSHPPELRGAFEDYLTDVKRIGTAVVRAMGDALGFDEDDSAEGEGPDVFVRATERSLWVLRMIGYPGLSEQSDSDDAEQFSCGEHTDYGCLTLLLADSTPDALQVQTKAGEWISADPLPGAFVVNIGDMIERWTNGLW